MEGEGVEGEKWWVAFSNFVEGWNQPSNVSYINSEGGGDDLCKTVFVGQQSCLDSLRDLVDDLEWIWSADEQGSDADADI